MALHLGPVPDLPVLKISNFRPAERTFVANQIRNMVAAVAIHHGEIPAGELVAEAFAEVFAEWAHDKNRAIAYRYALEVTIDHAFAEADTRARFAQLNAVPA